MRRHHHYDFARLVLVLVLLFPAAASSDLAETEDCYDTCNGFGTWIWGKGWLVPPYKTVDIGNCLQRGLNEPGWENDANGGNGRGGQSNVVQAAMIRTYDRVMLLSESLQATVVGDSSVGVAAQNANQTAQEAVAETLLAGLNAASEGATVPNSEGLYYCLYKGLDNNNGNAAGKSGKSAKSTN